MEQRRPDPSVIFALWFLPTVAGGTSAAAGLDERIVIGTIVATAITVGAGTFVAARAAGRDWRRPVLVRFQTGANAIGLAVIIWLLGLAGIVSLSMGVTAVGATPAAAVVAGFLWGGVLAQVFDAVTRKEATQR